MLGSVSVRPVASEVEVVCFRPADRLFPAFEARLRAACEGVRLVFTVSGAVPAGVYRSPVWPTVVTLVDGQVLGQASGDLPLWELRSLLARALACAQRVPPSADGGGSSGSLFFMV